MAVTILERRSVGPTAWRLTWESDATPPVVYRIYIDGILVSKTTQTYRTFEMSLGDQLQVEIRDDDTAPIYAYPGKLLLTWEPVSGADKYNIQEYSGSAWTLRGVVQSSGKTYYSFYTPTLADCETHQWRILPIGADGAEGTAKTFSVFMVRRPDPPTITATYDDETYKATVTVG